jgi:alkylated DNA repair protein (DNA oxidative demethylase)
MSNRPEAPVRWTQIPQRLQALSPVSSLIHLPDTRLDAGDREARHNPQGCRANQFRCLQYVSLAAAGTSSILSLMSLPDGFRYLPDYFDRSQQTALVEAVLDAAKTAPFYRPRMPRTGQPLSVTMTNFGPLGWVTDKEKGYRYEAVHPQTGAAWPAPPDLLTRLWDEVAGYSAPFEACLVNYYTETSRMGLHIDLDEDATDAAVVSVSLGDKARFRLGGSTRKDKTHSLIVSSGDVIVLGGAARRCYHGIDRIYPGTSTLVPDGGRLNLTMRRVTLPA